MRATLKAVAGLFLLLLVSACLVETEATLADPDPGAMDQRLVGTWYSAKGGEAMIIAVVADDTKQGAYRVAFLNVNPFAVGAIEGTRFEAWRTVLNGKAYLNLRRTEGNVADMPKLTIIAYDLGENGTLVLRLMDTKAVIAAIEAGKLKGRFKRGTYVDEATITSPRAELAAFLASSDRDALFPDKSGPLRKLPDTPN